MNKKTLVLGASDNSSRYSFLAIKRLLSKGYPVYAVGKHSGQVDGNPIVREVEDWQDIDTVTVYLNPVNQKPYYDYLQRLKPRRVIFNPGAENHELKRLLETQGTEVLFACTLVMLSTGQF